MYHCKRLIYSIHIRDSCFPTRYSSVSTSSTRAHRMSHSFPLKAVLYRTPHLRDSQTPILSFKPSEGECNNHYTHCVFQCCFEEDTKSAVWIKKTNVMPRKHVPTSFCRLWRSRRAKASYSVYVDFFLYILFCGIFPVKLPRTRRCIRGNMILHT